MPETTDETSRKGIDKRRLILDSALHVFADKGYDGTRISDIARDAQIAYGLVYHYFKNKEEILDTIFLERWSGFIDEVESVASEPASIEEKLLRIAGIIASAYSERSEWAKVLVFEIQRSQRLADPTRLQHVGRLFRRIAEILRAGQERGELRREIDPDLACYIFVGGLDIVVTSRVLQRAAVAVDQHGPEPGRTVGRDEDAFAGKLARTVVDLFLSGMRETGSKPMNR